jgi:uncharacterized protein
MNALAETDRKPPALALRREAINWRALEEQLDAFGHATTGPLLTPAEAREVRGWYGEAERFRARIVMRRHGFGEGEYQYFANPLPALVAELRRLVYPRLCGIANRWQHALGLPQRFPDSLEAYLAACHAAGQRRPTPLLLKYGAGDYNRLHQDLYGALHFPLQMAILLSAPGEDFAGGEFVLTEQRPRSQSRADVVPLGLGEAVIFAVNQRPAKGARGFYRLTMRHGVSRIRAGERFTLGIIFHDAA